MPTVSTAGFSALWSALATADTGLLNERFQLTLLRVPPGARRLLSFGAFALLSSLPYLLLTGLWARFAVVLQQAGLLGAAWPTIESTAPVPGRLVGFHLVALAAWWAPGAWRWIGISVATLGMGVVVDLLEPAPIAVFFAVCALMYGLFLCPVPRPVKLAFVVIVPLALRWVGHEAGWQTLDRTGTSLGLLVALWYACYEVTTQRPFSFPRYMGYLQTRLFMEGPVLSPEDVRASGLREIDAVRWSGFKTLAVALAARSVSFHIERWLGADWRDATGATLLGYSYLNYLSLSLGLVFSYNLALGAMRLFGLPVRDNFEGWLWARTPNEHWRRWNVLFREWIITFTFYPIMRARKNLFLAVMLTLATSGVLHLYGMIFGGPLPPETIALIMGYWLVNGLAIYVVVSFPRWFPAAVDRLRLADHPAWWVTGWLLTNVFYAVLFFLHHECRSFAEAGAFFSRLAGGGA